MNKKPMKEETIGYARFGAFMHKYNGGKVNISSYTSVNKPLSVDSADETIKIAERTFRIVEEEKPYLNGNKFYEKDVWNEQTGDEPQTYNNSSSRPQKNEVDDDEDYDEPSHDNSKSVHSVDTLKNFVDNIASDIRGWKPYIIGALILGLGALIIAVLK